MIKSPEWERKTFSHGTSSMSMKVTAGSKWEAAPVAEIGPSTIIHNDDGTITYEMTSWFGPEEVKKYGTLNAVPMPPEMGQSVGFTIIQVSVSRESLSGALRSNRFAEGHGNGLTLVQCHAWLSRQLNSGG